MNRLRTTIGLLALAVIVGAIVIVTRPDANCSLRDRLRVEGPAELKEAEHGLSVIVSSDEGFTVGALAWILRIGDTEFSLSRYPESSTDRIEFPIPEDALSRLQDGDGIGIRYGNPISRSGSSLDGWAPAEGTVDRRAGFAILRILDDCRDR